MNLIMINEAEAIIEPFYDGATSDYDDHDKRYRAFDEYEVNALNGAAADIAQGWAFVAITVDKGVKNAPVLQMSRKCSINVGDYDTFILFGSFPKSFCFDLSAVVDGVKTVLCSKVKGTGSSDEYTAHICANLLTDLTLTIYCEQSAVQGTLCWFGVANSKRLSQMLERKNQYDKSWPGYFEAETPQQAKPDIGILFDGAELAELRKKLKLAPFCEGYQLKKQQAISSMQIMPEEYIGRYLPYFDRRWNRSRDKAWVDDLTKNASGMHTVIENLAFVGLIENDIEMMRMACRHAISVAHCEYWFESPMGNLPGATWHHRSFTENNFCRSVSLVLDWCGQLLTPFAKQVLYDALALKGLPRLESDFKRVEYIRYMNQGIVFSEGRIYALLALLPRYSRYESNIAEAEADLISMVNNYVQEDGGTLEGPGYWMFTFGEVVGAFYALARYHKKPFTHYSKLFEKTGDFALSMLSMEDDNTVLLATNDAHPKTHMSCAIASSLYQFTKKAEWKNLYERLLSKNLVDNNTFSLIVSPMGKGGYEEEKGIERIFPFTGQAGAVRSGSDVTTHIHLCSGPTYATHFHEDKGSLILEADGKVLCPDCGSANYFESELFYLSFPQSHSLLNPVMPGGILARQGRFEQGGKLCKTEISGEYLEFISDDTNAWSGGAYRSVQRKVISPFAELIILEDKFELDTAEHVEFLLNSFAEWRLQDNCACADFGGLTLRVQPLNWAWEAPEIRPMQDGEHRSVWQLRAPYRELRKGNLFTALCVEKQNKIEITQQEQQWIICRGAGKWRLSQGGLLSSV